MLRRLENLRHLRYIPPVEAGRPWGRVRRFQEDRVLTERMSEGAGGVQPTVTPASGAEEEKQSALLTHLLSSLDEDQAQDVAVVDLRGKSPMADHMVIASGRSSRQVQSIAEKLTARLKHDLGRAARIEGKAAGSLRSVVIDQVGRWKQSCLLE